MARRPALSTSTGGTIYVEEISDYFTLLDVVYANQFEGETTDQELVEQTEENFYRGAPPEWLNFHICYQAELNGTRSPFIKRDGYNQLVEEINRRKNGPGTSTVTFFHQQGCGGTTLAMQVLWEMRKTFRCAVLTDSTSEITKVAKEVVHLFTGGRKHNLNTVLLLLNDEFILDQLQDCVMAEVAQQQIDVDVPVVILLNCVRSNQAILKKEQVQREKEELKSNDRGDIILKAALSDAEKQQFDDKKKELIKAYGEKVKWFHGFNVLQTDFSQDYIQQVSAVFQKNERKKKPLKTQLAAFLSLLNSYVPDFYLLESECLDFLRCDDSVSGGVSLVDLMQPFSHLIISFKHGKSCGKKIRMAHPMIARCCTELLAEACVTRSDTARNFLTNFCIEEVSPYLIGFIKDLLTKREKKEDETTDDTEKYHGRSKYAGEHLENFSKLILEIKEKEDPRQSASVLKVASNKFVKNSYFPQALARFCYGELKDYKEAEIWAKTAKERDPKKSFIADTLGQVHKNHLKNKELPANPREILQLAEKAIEAFEHEERLAEEEHRKSLAEDEKSKLLRDLNTRGQFGFLQVCNILFDGLTSQNETWRGVLTNDVPMGSVLESLGDNKLFRFNGLIKSLREKVEKKFEFFDTFLTYSESINRKDKCYVVRDAAGCYKKYVGDSVPKHNKIQETLQQLKQKLAVTSAGVLSCLDRRFSLSDVQHIANWWEDLCHSEDFTTRAFVNCILANIMLSNKNNAPPSSDYKKALREKKPPSFGMQTEYHLLVLLLSWPTEDEKNPVPDLKQLIEHVKRGYEREYKATFRSRYLRPLFFIGPGKSLNRFVHRRNLEIVWTKDALQESNPSWKSEKIFKDHTVQDRLLRVDGVVRNYRVYATFRGMEVEVEANRRDGLWKSGDVSFYLGFTINGPVAFSIQRRLKIAGGDCEHPNTELLQGLHFVEFHQTALVERVKDTRYLLDKLLEKSLISKEEWDIIRATVGEQEQMRDILMCVISAGRKGKDTFYAILKGMKNLKSLMSELERIQRGVTF